jgi:shikimate dehydrogenase
MRLPLDVATLRPRLLVCDGIPNPSQTQLLRDAAERGCVTFDGLGVLVNQGVIVIRLWAQSDANPQSLRETLLQVPSGTS